MNMVRSKLVKKLQHYCGYQERCHQEVENKLSRMGADPELVGDILTELIDDGFLDELRYAKSIARGKFRIHHWGRNKIISLLKEKNIPNETIEIALEEIDDEEYRIQLQRLLRKLFEEKKDLNKTIQSLIQKGFETELVYELASGLNKQAG